MIEATATTVVTPMMMRRRVRKLRSVCARMESKAARSSSRESTSHLRRSRLVGLLLADGVAGLQLAQVLERTGHEGLPFLEAVQDLDRQLAGQPGLDRPERRLPSLHDEHPLFFL